ncbi:MAG TPA: alpha/beta hydrolase-fold protein, partial [Verrucomicrobiae bacterium]|nr:alpha/beta hydrolase-fold protein [Verrucomicrobiae bacterium]
MGRIQTIRNGAAPSAAMRARGATGDLRLHEFQSRVFRNTRFLRVWLPPNYDDAENSGRRYPVLYLNDGQNLFEAASSYAGVEWQVDETADRLIREGAVPPMIIV